MRAGPAGCKRSAQGLVFIPTTIETKGHPHMFRRALFITALLATASAPALANLALATKHSCTACHAVDKKLVGPGYQEVAKKYTGQKDAEAALIASVRKGSTGKWGQVPMPANTTPSDDEVKTLVKWILGGAK